MSHWMLRKQVSGTARALALTLCMYIVILGSMGGSAVAQDTGPPSSSAPAKSDTIEQVVVTGSRIARSTFNTANPVTVVNAQDIQNLGLINVGEVLAEIPQNSNFFSANNVGLGNFNVGAQLANLRGLNPFFGTRTLTLVDTERVVPQATGGGVDVSLIPSMLVASTEVVTGGASAIYGSDAVAGVVNIILDHNLNGFKSQLDYGQTSHHDGGTSHFSVAYGTDLGDRVHLITGAEYQNEEDIGICDQVRSWCKSDEAVYGNALYAGAAAAGPAPAIPANGLPHYIIGPNGTQANVSQTGVLTPCNVPVPGVCIPTGPQYNFNTAGTAATPFDPGTYADGAGVFGFDQGAGAPGIGAYDGTTLRPAIKRYTGLADLDVKVSDSVSAFLQVSYARSEAINPIANGALGPSPLEVGAGVFVPFVSDVIAPNNAYLPAQFQPGGANALPAGGALLGFNMNGIDPARNATNDDTVRITGGFKGSISSTWSWDSYFEWGINNNSQNLYHSDVSNFLQYALDAINVNGTIVCAATVPGNPAYTPAAAGCVPLNLFGAKNASPAALAYAFRDLQEYGRLTEEVVSGNVHGDLFSGFGAGSIKASFGAEVRRDTADVTHDLSQQPWYDFYSLSYGLDYAGTINVVEGNAEINVPVLKDLPLAKYLEFDGAIRETDNQNEDQTAGSATDGQEVGHDILSWKLSSIWDVTDWLRFRGTRSLDVRAAGFRELYESYAVQAGGPFGSITNPANAAQNEVIEALTGGNIDLKPERADTTTVGFVLSPTSGPLEGFQFSADWYDILLHDPITGPPFGLGVQNIVNLCYLDHADCDRITFGTPGNFGTITAVNNTAVNLGSYETKGVDFETDYKLPLMNVNSHLNGDLQFRMLTSLLYNMTIDTGLPGTTPIDYAGQSGPTGAFGGFNTSPRWQSNLFMTYSNGPLTTTLQVRWIGPGTFETLSGFGGIAVAPGDPGYATTNPNSINNNSVASATYLNLSGTYAITNNVSAFVSIDNLLNKSPPVAPGGNGYPTNPVYFDTLGMTWKVGFRAKF